MSKLDLTIIREILIDEQIALTANIQNEEGKMQQYTEQNPAILDLADKHLHQEIVVSRLSRMKQHLTQVRVALNRLDEGKYGICAKCSSRINPERLKIIPSTTLCVNCQERFERANR